MTENKRARRGTNYQVPSSSFDLLEGTAQVRERTRILNMVVAAAMVAVVLGLGTIGARDRVDAANSRNTTSADEAAAATVRAELEQRRAAGEVSGPSVSAFIEKRLRVAEIAVRDETDVARIMSDLLGIGGVTIDSITLSSGSAEAAPATEGDTGETPIPAASDADAKITSISVTGTALSLDGANQAAAALNNQEVFPYLSDGKAGQVSCTADTGCKWMWTGTVTDAARTDRLAGLEESVTPAKAKGGS